jgi:hypothetical protein
VIMTLTVIQNLGMRMRPDSTGGHEAASMITYSIAERTSRCRCGYCWLGQCLWLTSTRWVTGTETGSREWDVSSVCIRKALVNYIPRRLLIRIGIERANCRKQDVGRRTQNTEHRTQNTEHRM